MSALLPQPQHNVVGTTPNVAWDVIKVEHISHFAPQFTAGIRLGVRIPFAQKQNIALQESAIILSDLEWLDPGLNGLKVLWPNL